MAEIEAVKPDGREKAMTCESLHDELVRLVIDDIADLPDARSALGAGDLATAFAMLIAHLAIEHEVQIGLDAKHCIEDLIARRTFVDGWASIVDLMRKADEISIAKGGGYLVLGDLKIKLTTWGIEVGTISYIVSHSVGGVVRLGDTNMTEERRLGLEDLANRALIEIDGESAPRCIRVRSIEGNNYSIEMMLPGLDHDYEGPEVKLMLLSQTAVHGPLTGACGDLLLSEISDEIKSARRRQETLPGLLEKTKRAMTKLEKRLPSFVTAQSIVPRSLGGDELDFSVKLEVYGDNLRRREMRIEVLDPENWIINGSLADLLKRQRRLHDLVPKGVQIDPVTLAWLRKCSPTGALEIISETVDEEHFEWHDRGMFHGPSGRRLPAMELSVQMGRLSGSFDLGQGVKWLGGPQDLVVESVLPQTLCMSMIGRPVTEFVQHEVLSDHAIESVETNDKDTVIHLTIADDIPLASLENAS